jgi:hypothetical protein
MGTIRLTAAPPAARPHPGPDSPATGDASRSRRAAARAPRLAELLLALPVFAAVWLGTLRQLALLDSDYFWHLAVGRLILAGGIPTADPFSFTHAGAPWRPHQWLTEAGLAGAYGLAGHAGPVLLLALAALALWVTVYARARQFGATRLAALVLLLAGLITVAPLLAPRPHLLLWLGAALTALIVERALRDSSPRQLLWLPALGVLWANLHTGAPPLMAGIAGLGALQAGWDRWRRGRASGGSRGHGGTGALVRAACSLPLALAGTAALVLAAGAATPAGLGGLALVGGTLANAAPRALIEEWQSPDFHRAELRPFEVMLLVGLVLAGWWGRRLDRFWPYGLLLAVGTAAAGLESARHVPLFALLAGPWLAAVVPLREAPAPRPRRPVALALVGLSLALVVAGGVMIGPLALAARERAAFPAAAVDWLAAHGAGERRLVHEYDWGGYLIWRGLPVFVDGRAEVLYEPAFLFGARAALAAGPGWPDLLRRHGVDAALLRPETPLAAALRQAGWQVCWSDAQAVVLRPACAP